MIHYLKFPSINEAIGVIQANEPSLLWIDNGVPHIRGSHDFAVDLVGDVYHKTGVILEDDSEEQVLVAGYHVNINAVGRVLPAYLIPFEVFPVTPSVSFGE